MPPPPVWPPVHAKSGALLLVVALVLAIFVAPPAYADRPNPSPRPSAAVSSTTEPGSNASFDTSTDARFSAALRHLADWLNRWRLDSPSPPRQPKTKPAPTHLLGSPRSGMRWHSGAWVGGRFTSAGIRAFGQMRGAEADLVTTYGYAESPTQMSSDQWPITTWKGFPGKLNYGLPLAFKDGTTTAAVASGAADEHYRAVARALVRHHRGDAVIRVGWEFNYHGWPWGTTADNVDSFKKAFRRVVRVMHAEAPDLVFEFGINCGDGLTGASDRLAPLTQGYPGDDVVDIVGCDTYDRWSAHAANAASWKKVLRGDKGPGIADVTDFARRHGKGAGFGEWGLAKPDGKNNGGGDNPFYIAAMYRFFEANSDVVVFECYFDENNDEMGNSLVLNQMPRARAEYARLWGS